MQSGRIPSEEKLNKLGLIQQKIQAICIQLREMHPEISLNDSIVTYSDGRVPNSDTLPLEISLTMKRYPSHQCVFFHDELYYLINLYNAIVNQTKTSETDLNNLGIDDHYVALNYFSNSTKFDMHNFLWNNGLAYGFLKEFGSLSNTINAMNDADPRKVAAQDFYSQAAHTFNSGWLCAERHKALMLKVLRATNELLLNPTQDKLQQYRKLAEETNKIGKWRLFTCAMLTLGTTILLASLTIGMLPIMIPAIGTGIAVMMGLAFAGMTGMTGGIAGAVFMAMSGNIFGTANRTRVLGNDMTVLASKNYSRM